MTTAQRGFGISIAGNRSADVANSSDSLGRAVLNPSSRDVKLLPRTHVLDCLLSGFAVSDVMRYDLHMVAVRILSVWILLTCIAVVPVRGEPADDAARLEAGVKAFQDSDYQKAKDILLPLAEKGNPEAIHHIGRLHENTSVFPNDPKLECDWYERAAKLGLGKSMYNLSNCFYFGTGRKKDPEQMLYWLTQAAEHGVIDAMLNLGAMDETYGEEYRRWANMAVQHGSKYAMVRLWQLGYKQDVPDIRIRDITCTYIRILLFDEDITACDNLK